MKKQPDQLAEFAREILRLGGKARRLTGQAMDLDREAGEVCRKARAACKEAGVPWEPWCEEHLGAIGGLRTVQRLMKVAKNWKRIERERRKTPDLTTTAALRLLVNARKRQQERTTGARPESREQTHNREGNAIPRLAVSRPRSRKIATAMGLDPEKALGYLHLMVGAAGVLVTVTDD